MKMAFFIAVFASFISIPSDSYAKWEKPNVDLQFFGDLYIPYHVVKKTKTTSRKPTLFKNLRPLLDSSDNNIVNFEGVSTGAFVPKELKLFLLNMPLWISGTLRDVGINVAALANNHAYDYGYQGLFDSIVSLNKAGIQTFGAGDNIAEAIKPAIVHTSKGFACLLAFSRTLPASFWAKKNRAGTAFLDYKKTANAVKDCKKKGYFTVAIFHWGQESISKSKNYQRELAKVSIDAGADVVLGHHPHILQEISTYKGKPIFYSLGNFTFGSYTKTKPQEGAALRIRIKKNPEYEIVPINVQNSEVKYIPRLFDADEENPLEKFIPKRFCKKKNSHYLKKTLYTCKFS